MCFIQLKYIKNKITDPPPSQTGKNKFLKMNQNNEYFKKFTSGNRFL